MWRRAMAFAAAVVLAGSVTSRADEGTPEKESSVGKIAASAEATTPLEAGAQMPEVTLINMDGEPVALQEIEQPAVLIFYRGGWCPYCNTHLGKLSEIESDLSDLGYEILAIAPDKPEKLAETKEKEELGYTLLSDAKVEAAKAFGLAFKVDDETIEKYKGYGIDLEASSGEAHHALPVPAVYVVDKAGTIRFFYADTDYKERLDNAKLMEAAKKAAM